MPRRDKRDDRRCIIVENRDRCFTVQTDFVVGSAARVRITVLSGSGAVFAIGETTMEETEASFAGMTAVRESAAKSVPLIAVPLNE